MCRAKTCISVEARFLMINSPLPMSLQPLIGGLLRRKYGRASGKKNLQSVEKMYSERNRFNAHQQRIVFLKCGSVAPCIALPSATGQLEHTPTTIHPNPKGSTPHSVFTKPLDQCFRFGRIALSFEHNNCVATKQQQRRESEIGQGKKSGEKERIHMVGNT